MILDKNGNPIKQENKEPIWMPIKEALFHAAWYQAKETEIWETGHQGYAKTGIVTENSKWLDRVNSGEITMENLEQNPLPIKH